MSTSENASDGGRPGLAGAGPVSVHFDERDRSAGVTVQRTGLPDDAPDAWQQRGCNAYETVVTYRDIDDVAVAGWTHVPLEEWALAEQSDASTGPARIAVTLSGPGQCVSFTADPDVRTWRRGLRTGSV